MAKKTRWKRVVRLSISLALFAVLFGYVTNRAVLDSSEGRIHTKVDSVPFEPVGLVLGASPTFGTVKNIFFERRMDAAAELYRAHKVRKLLVSGDNGRRGYDEPTAMRDALVSRGVPIGDIVLDYAGFRTLDSVVRAKAVFGLDRCTIVTDDFHLARALYIARERGIDAVGYQTRPISRSVSPWTYIRELGARTLVWTDLHILNRQPRFGGPPEPIRVAQQESPTSGSNL